MLERWPQVSRTCIMVGFLPTNWFVSTQTNPIKCTVNWIPLKIRVRSRNTQPYINVTVKKRAFNLHKSVLSLLIFVLYCCICTYPDNHVYVKKSPTIPQNSPVFLQKSPVYPEKSLVFPQKSTSFNILLLSILAYAYIPKYSWICAFIEKGDDVRTNSCMCGWERKQVHMLCVGGGGRGWGGMTQRYIMWLTPVCVTWLDEMCDMTHSCMWHDSCMRVTRPIPMCDMTHSYVWHDSCICVTWPIHMCDMTHPYVWLIQICDMTHSDVWHDSFICVTLLIQIQILYMAAMCDMTESHAWHDALNASWHTHERTTAGIWIRHGTQAEARGWSTQRHYSRPTTDMRLQDLWDTEVSLSFLHSPISPQKSPSFSPKGSVSQQKNPVYPQKSATSLIKGPKHAEKSLIHSR